MNDTLIDIEEFIDYKIVSGEDDLPNDEFPEES